MVRTSTRLTTAKSQRKKKNRSTRPEWSAKFERLLSNRQRCQIFVEISIIMGDYASPIEVGKELANKHTQYNSAMWTAYYEEWKRHNGKPLGYGTENQVEPWISDEVFNELVDAEIDLWGKDKVNMGFVSKQLVAKYGVYSEGSWKRHGQNRLTDKPSPGRAAATVRHGAPSQTSPISIDNASVTPTTSPSKKKTKSKPKLTPIIPPPRVRPARNVPRPSYRISSPTSPLTPPPTESVTSSSPVTPLGQDPAYSAPELKVIFQEWYHLVQDGMEEFRFARFLDRKFHTNHVTYWMNMYDAWLSEDGPFERSSQTQETKTPGQAISLDTTGGKKKQK